MRCIFLQQYSLGTNIPVTILKCLYICVDHICYKDFTELMELCTEQPDGMTVVHFQL